MSLTLDKATVARRQLATGIRLQFDAGDPVSIFTLAANAWEIIDTLCRLEDVPSFSNDMREHVPESKELKRDYVNSPFRNFFKHADHDPEAVLTGFSEFDCDHMLYMGTEDYIRLKRRSPIEFQIFQLWYLALYPGKVKPARLANILETVDEAFPGIRALTRKQQLEMGVRVLNEARSDATLINDPRTEAAF